MTLNHHNGDIDGETREENYQAAEDDRRRDDLIDLGWEILDMLPKAEQKKLIMEIIDLIIEKGWDK